MRPLIRHRVQHILYKIYSNSYHVTRNKPDTPKITYGLRQFIEIEESIRHKWFLACVLLMYRLAEYRYFFTKHARLWDLLQIPYFEISQNRFCELVILTIFNKKYWHISDINVWIFKETLTNDVVSFEQPGPDVYKVDFWSSSMKASKLWAETTCCGSWFHILMVLGKRKYRWAFTDDCGMRYLMLRPLVTLAATGIRYGVDGTATSPYTMQ